MDIQESTNQWGYFCGSFGGMGCIILRKLLEENAIEAPFFWEDTFQSACNGPNPLSKFKMGWQFGDPQSVVFGSLL